jgi:uncharacterized membrane protein
VAAIQSVHKGASPRRIEKIFELSDVDSSRHIDFKEYVTALTIAATLNELPPTGLNDSSENREYEELREALSLIISSYLLFDLQCEGFFSRNTPHSPGGSFLSEERWNEMVSVHF